MADFPTLIDYTQTVIGPGSQGCIEDYWGWTSGYVPTTASSGAWPTANKAIFLPFRIAYPSTVVKMFWINGSTVGTNHVDVGIYDSQGNQLVHSGSTLTSGASAVQSVDIADTLLQRGLYYMAMVIDGTTDTTNRAIPAAAACNAVGLQEMTSAFTLPATATYAAPTSAWLPGIFATLQTTI